MAIPNCLFALNFSGYPITAAGTHDNVMAGSFGPDFNFDVVNAARRMVRRVKANSVLMAQLFDDLSEGLFQIADLAAEVTTGGNLRQSPQKIHRFFISLLDAARSSLPAPISIWTLWRIGKKWRRCEDSIAPAHPQSSFRPSSRPAPPAARGLPVTV